MAKLKSKTTTKIEGYCRPLSVEECHAGFVKSMTKDKDKGSNVPRVQEFLLIANLLLTYKSFNADDAINVSRSTNLESSSVISLFTSWKDHMLKYKKLKPVQGVYDSEVFTPI